MDKPPEISGIAGATPDRSKADIWSLVLWAVGIPHAVTGDTDGWSIRVEPDLAETARREIADFERENMNWPPEDPVADRASLRSDSNPPTVLLMGMLALFHFITGPWAKGNTWFEQGAVAGEKILNHGEWWRLLTGLTLHADAVHLAGNVLIGGFLVHFLCRTIGTGMGWVLILLAGMGGNYINILSHGAGHNSVGFSTAVFGTIGIMTGRQAIKKRRLTVKEVLLPIAAGFGLLAFLGTAGEHTDLGAHFYGLLTGMVLGALIAPIRVMDREKVTPLVQTILVLLCLLFVVYSWDTALTGL